MDARFQFEEGSGNTTANSARPARPGTLLAQADFTADTPDNSSWALRLAGGSNLSMMVSEDQYTPFDEARVFWLRTSQSSALIGLMSLQSHDCPTLNSFSYSGQPVLSEVTLEDYGSTIVLRDYQLFSSETQSLSEYVAYSVRGPAPCPLNDDVWHHIVVSRATNGLIDIYADGTLLVSEQNTNMAATEAFVSDDPDLRLGAPLCLTSEAASAFLVGSMDDYRSYDSSLTAANVAELCANCTCRFCIFWHSFCIYIFWQQQHSRLPVSHPPNPQPPNQVSSCPDDDSCWEGGWCLILFLLLLLLCCAAVVPLTVRHVRKTKEAAKVGPELVPAPAAAKPKPAETRPVPAEPEPEPELVPVPPTPATPLVEHIPEPEPLLEPAEVVHEPHPTRPFAKVCV